MRRRAASGFSVAAATKSDQTRSWTAGRIGCYVAAALIAILVLGIAIEWRDIARVVFVHGLFRGGDQVERFRNVRAFFPGHEIQRAARPFAFVDGAPLSLPDSFSNGRGTVDTAGFLAGTDTTGLLVLRDDRLVYEHYWRAPIARRK